MKHLFVPYTLAVALKEKGFNEECPCYWGAELGFDPVLMPFLRRFTNVNVEGIRNSDLLAENEIAAPLYQQVVDWFREAEGVHISVERDWENGNMLGFEGITETDSAVDHTKTYPTYYEALQEAINQALNIIQ